MNGSVTLETTLFHQVTDLPLTVTCNSFLAGYVSESFAFLDSKTIKLPPVTHLPVSQLYDRVKTM
jgi:hypothetical protein